MFGWLRNWRWPWNPAQRGFRASDVERGIYKLEPSPGLREKLQAADKARRHDEDDIASPHLSDAARRFIGSDKSSDRIYDVVVLRTPTGGLGNWMHRRRIDERAPCPICHSHRDEPCTDRDMRGLPVVTGPTPQAPPVKPPAEARILYRGSATDLATDIIHALPRDKVVELVDELVRKTR